MLSYLQICGTLVGFVEIPWPTYFQKVVSALAFVNLEFIPVLLARFSSRSPSSSRWHNTLVLPFTNFP
jgi:hypothetical protein